MILPNLGRRGSNLPAENEGRLVALERAVARLSSRALGRTRNCTVQRVAKTAHGWSVGTWAKELAGTWSTAQASSSFTADAIGVVVTVVDADTVDVVIDGDVQLFGTSFTAWSQYFLSTSAGTATSTKPTAPTVVQPLFVALEDGWIHVGPSPVVARSVRLSELLDVLLTSPANGDVPTYNTASSKWVNQAPVSISLPLSVANGGTARTGITSGTFWYASSTDTLAEATITAFGRTLVACADAAAGRTQLALAAIAASGSGADLTIASVTLAKMADLAQARIIGRASGAGTGVPTALTGTQATAILDEMVASGASHAKGLVPDPPASSGTTKFLREDATWAIPSGAAATGSCNKITSGAQTVTSGTSNATITTWTAVGTATLSGIDVTTGIFTVPSDGLYLVTAYVYPTYTATAAGQQWDAYVDRNNAGSSDPSFGRLGFYSFDSHLAGPFGSFSGVRFLTAGDTLRLRISNTGANTLTVAEAHFNIVKLA